MKRVLADNATVAHFWAHQRQPEGRTSSGNMSFQGPILYSYALRIGKLVEHQGQTIALVLDHGPTPTTNCKHLPAMRGATSHLPKLEVCTVPDVLSAHWGVLELEWAIHDTKKEQKSIANKRKNIEWAIDHYNNIFVPGKNRLVDFIRNHPLDGLTTERNTALQALLTELVELLPLPELGKLKEKAKETAAQERETRKAKEAKDKALFDEYLADWKNGTARYLKRIGKYPEYTHLRICDFAAYGGPDTGVCVQTSQQVRLPLDEAKQAYLAFKKGRLLGQKLAGYTITQVDTVKKVVIAGCHTVPFAEIEEIGGKL